MSVQTQTTTVEPGAILMGRYVIDRRLGSGGMGKVYLAHQRPFDRPVVIKVMHERHVADDSLRQRFYNEAQAASRLSHPNTITVYDFGEAGEGLHFIAMEYVDGRSLHEELTHNGPMTLDRAVPLILQVAQSLGEAHRKGVIHRDLKLENIMISTMGSGDEFAKVLDFGIAKLTESKVGLTQTGSVFGTPGYMPPEQANGKGELDARADLYALTCCLYELITGQLPFQGESALSVLMKHQTDPVPDLPPSLPRSLDAFIKRGMAKKPSQRPAGADDYVAELLACFVDSPQRAHRVTPRHGRQAVSSQHRVSGSARTEETSGAFQTQQRSVGNLRRPEDSAGSNPHERATLQSPVPAKLALPHPDSIGSSGSREQDSGQRRQSANRPRRPSDALPAPGKQVTPSGSITGTGPHSEGAEPENTDPGMVGRGFEDSSPSDSGPNSAAPQSGSVPGYRPSTGPESSSWTAPPAAGSRSVPLSWVVAASSVVVAIGALLFAVTNSPQQTAGNIEQDRQGASATTASASRPTSINLAIDSRPQQASVFADDKRLGTTPTSLSLEPGSNVNLRVEKRGFRTETFANYRAGNSPDLELSVPLERATIALSVQSPLDGAELMVNGTSYGKLPSGRTRNLQVVWPDGALELRIRHPEHADYVERLPPGALDDEMTLAPDRADFVEATAQ